MASRLDLHEKLKNILGNNNVYFQPPSQHIMEYPCIRYGLSKIDKMLADNKSYINTKAYSITLIHKNPDNDIVDKLAELPMCALDNIYQANNLNHYVFILYY